MDIPLLDPTGLRWSSSNFFTSNKSSLKFIAETFEQPNPPSLYIHVLKRSSDASSKGLQKDPKKKLSRILRTDAAIREIERKANSKKYNNLWPKAVLEALDDAIRGNLWETALKIFGLLRKQHWYKPRCQTYTKLLMMLGKCKQPGEAGILFEIMLSEGLKPAIDVYTALVSAYGQSGLLDKALSTIDEMKSVSDCIPDVYTYSTLLTCCFKFRKFDLVENILAEMSYRRIPYNAVIYNSIIDGYGKAEMFELMENSLSDMVESGDCDPDIFTLNSLISAYGNNGQIEKMEKWYNEFLLMSIEPDGWTFNILIRSYGKAKMYEKMTSVMDYMEKRFFPLTIVTFNTVIEVFGRARKLEKMDEYFLKMKHRGMKPNSVTYCSLVSAYSKAGCIEKVDSTLNQVENSDVELDTSFFNCIISAYGQAGDLKKMVKLFMAMKERRCVPDSITYATMIQAFNAQGMTEAARNLEKNLDNQPKLQPFSLPKVKVVWILTVTKVIKLVKNKSQNRSMNCKRKKRSESIISTSYSDSIKSLRKLLVELSRTNPQH